MTPTNEHESPTEARPLKGLAARLQEFGAHQMRVAAAFAVGSVEWRVALYHDHLEDGLDDVPDEIREHVLVLTRGVDEDYRDYISRIIDSHDPVATAVKIADARDNLARCRGEFGGQINSNRARRYEYVLKRLEATP